MIISYIIILDSKGNKVKEFSYNLFLDSDSSITKFISFTPTGAGSYTIKAQVKEKDLLLKEVERDVIVQIAKPEVILSLSKTETTLPDDVMVQVQIRNGPVPRDYDVYLYVYAPDGSLIQQEKKSVSVSENTVRTVIFTSHLTEELPAGPYLFLARVKFKVENKIYSIDTQKTLTAITSAPSIYFELRVPQQVENDKNFVYLLDIKHQSTRQYDYYYQCFIYDPDGILVKQDPPSPNLISLQAKEVTTIKQEFTIPSDWKEGVYTITCRFWKGDNIWEDTKQFIVKQPPEYINLIVMPYYKEGKIITSVCYSTKALSQIPAKLIIYYKSPEGILSVDGPHQVKLKNHIECLDSKFKPPEFVDPREVTIEAVLSYSGTEISKTANITPRKSIYLECDKDVVTPEDPTIKCSIVAPESGDLIIGIVPENVQVPTVWEGITKVFTIYEELNVTRTAVISLSTKDISYEKAKVVTLFKDKNDFIYKVERDFEVVPASADIRSVNTFSDLYYKDDKNKPMIKPGTVFYQDVIICSKSSVPITVKIRAEAPSDLVTIPMSNVYTIELAPKQCITKTFVFKAGKYLPTERVKITYSLYLVKDRKEYLLKTKTFERPAPETYWKLKEPRKKLEKSQVIIIIIALMIVFLALFVYFSRRKKIEEVTYQAPPQPPMQGEQG